MSEIKILLSRLADSARAAQAHYQVWFTLTRKGKALPEYHKDINDLRYVDFFHATNPGHYKIMIIELGCLFDTDARAASFRNLKKKLKEANKGHIVNKIDHALYGYEKLVSNILTIRSKLIAHKETDAKGIDIYKKYGVVPTKIGKLISICCSLINDINTELYGGDTILAPVTDRFEKATFRLLETLRNGRS